MTTNGDRREEVTRVRLRLPASLEYVHVVRLTTLGLASRLGFDVDDIEDVRIAVNELANVAVEEADHGELEVVFAIGDDELRIDGRVPVAPHAQPNIDALTEQILDAVCDEHTFEVVDGCAHFTCRRRARVLSA